MDRVRAGLRIGELVGMTLTDFSIADDGEVELHFEDQRLCLRADCDVDAGGDAWIDVEVR